jgi:hypothetical protein
MKTRRDDLPRVSHPRLRGRHCEPGCGCGAVGGNFFARARLRGIGWGGNCRCYGVDLCSYLPVAAEPCRSHCDALPSGLYWHRPPTLARRQMMWKAAVEGHGAYDDI